MYTNTQTSRKPIIFRILSMVFFIIPSFFLNAQTLEWAKTFGSKNSDFGISIATDATGNVYTTGSFDEMTDFDPGPDTNFLSPNGNNDIFIHKMDAQGNLLWVKTFGDNRAEGGYAITVDKTGNVYVTGYFTGTINFNPPSTIYEFTESGNGNIFVLKMDTDGNTLWAKAMGGPKGETGSSISIDDSGNIYTTGWFSETVDFDPGMDTFLLTSKGKSDIFVHKMDNDGNFLWAKSFGGADSDYGYSIRIDATGNIFTTGNFLETVDFDPGEDVFNITCTGQDDSFVQKLDADGNFLWVRVMEGSADVYALSMDVDDFGNVLTTGAFRETADFNPGTDVETHVSAGLNDMFIQKINADGQLVWAKSLGNAGRDVGVYVYTDAAGNVYTTGGFSETVDFDAGEAVANLTSAGKSDIFIQKLDPAGNFLWAHSFGGISDEDGYSVTGDENGNIFLLSNFQETVDFTTGTTTTTHTSNGYSDVVILKLSEITSGISDENTGVFLTAYPNPTFDILNILFEKPVLYADLEITDIQGKVIFSKQIENVSQEQIDLQTYSGIYFLHVRTQNSRSVIKVVKK